jgi:hypothetical protein
MAAICVRRSQSFMRWMPRSSRPGLAAGQARRRFKAPEVPSAAAIRPTPAGCRPLQFAFLKVRRIAK